ncbi:hypothetical protein ABZ671_01010 [Micromonospora sp. NPDC006766]|uniref:hypothetical protein n=1 Tax=Micromonospora sp. NPDC006766 TaxID=3154778 RepID=UPI003406154C
MTVVDDLMPGGVPGEPAPAAGWNPLPAITGALNTVPGWAWLTTAISLFIVLAVMRHRLMKAYEVNPPKTGQKLGGLFIAAVVLAAALWGCILAASGINVLGFTRDTVHWHGGREWLIFAALDGTAVVFAVLMFTAALVGRPTGRAFRIVVSSTLMSSAMGFWHGLDGTAGSIAAAVILGYLALVSMGVLHELLDLFQSTTAKRAPRVRPPFGLRWITYLPNTACAWLAWENHPPRPLPADATPEQVAWWGSVRHAVAHLETVRRAKRVRRYQVDRLAGGVPAVGWARVNPWLRVRQIDATLVDLRDTSAAELARVREQAAVQLDQVRADAAAKLDAARVELDTVGRQLAETAALFEAASDEAERERAARQVAEQQATVAGRQAADLTATLGQVRLDAARQVSAAEQAAAMLRERADRLDADLTAAREQAGQARAEITAAREAADRAAAEAAEVRRRLAEATATAEQQRADLTAAITRTAAERDTAIAAARTAAKTAAAPAAISGGGGRVAAGRGGTTTDSRGGSPTSRRRPTEPPWDPDQLAAFAAVDAGRTQDEAAAEAGVAAPTIRRWLAHRAKHTARTLPAVPISDPKQPALSGTNGTALHH